MTAFLRKPRIDAGHCLQCFAIASIATIAGGCASTETLPFETRITMLQGGAQAKYRFDVYGDPGLKLDPTIQRSGLPAHEQIRAGMRRYAEDEVRKRGLCENGFKGPDMVLGQKMSPGRFFFIECLPHV